MRAPPDPIQLREMTSLLQDVDDAEAAKKAVPLIVEAHKALTDKIGDFNERHVEATHAKHVKWADARKVADIVGDMDKKVREEAGQALRLQLQGVGIPVSTAIQIANYLSQIIVKSFPPEREAGE